jgi:serine/threonine protein kinase
MGVDVAVKVLEPAAHPDLEAIGRFRSEAHVSALLAHRSVVRVFDLLEEADGTLALVMELLVGQTLEQKLDQDGKLSPEIALATVVPILGALEHAHAVGVVHRDVKPGNIFLALEPDGRVVPKLLDFGVAKYEGQGVKTLDGNVLGTSRYMSPEQVRGETLDGRSDLFSVGALLYEAMTGTSPFAAPHVALALKRVLEQTVDADEHIPPRLWLVLQKALAKQPYARHASANALAGALLSAVGKTEEELAGLLKGERPPLPKLETPVTDASWSSRSAEAPARRASWALALGAGALVIALAAIATRFIPLKAAPEGTAAKAAVKAQVLEAAPTLGSSAPAPTTPVESTLPHPARPPHVAAPPAATSHPKAIATTPGF